MPTQTRPAKTSGTRSPTQRIAALNDRMRKNPKAHGDTLVSEGFVILGENAIADALRVIAGMRPRDFEGYLDPYGERKCNSFWLNGRLAYFRIGYYTKDDLRVPADDPTDPARTTRVMHVSFWDEERSGAHD